jgi:hypothetical protein
MRSSVPGRSMKLCSGMLLAFLAWVLVAPQSALAGCSSHQAPIISIGFGLETLDHAGDLAVAEVNQIPGRPKPCNGAMCSGKPAMPVSPAAPKILRVVVWAILEITPQIGSTDWAGSRNDEGDVQPIHSSASIFHPPRLSPSLLDS